MLHQVNKQAYLESRPELCKRQAEPAEHAHEANKLREYKQSIHALPLFAGLDSETLQDILKFARVISYSKGSRIFLQGERVSRFYVILEGWIKLFKGNAEGQESILQMASDGGILLETVIFDDAPFPVSAQAVDNVKLLSIPAFVMREKVRRNKELAINMLSAVAGRSQQLISQLEQLTLKTVTQRVGWFLLQRFLENNNGGGKFKLPYDKSHIAGFLGMKPETFSRALQALKEQGINIDRNTVSLPDIFALCGYCDTEIAAKCTRAGTKDCANTVSTGD